MTVNRLLRENLMLSVFFSGIGFLGWLIVTAVPWVILTWLVIKKEYGPQPAQREREPQ